MTTLFCLLKDESFVDAFSVEVDNTDSIINLKRSIRKELQPPLNEIALKLLRIHSVFIPMRDSLALENAKLQIDSGESLPVDPLELVKNVFDLQPNHQSTPNIRVIVTVSGKSLSVAPTR
jgi:hypothetical protein